MAALRAARQGLQALTGLQAPAWAAQQSSGFTSLSLGSWWHGTGSAAAASAAVLGWQRVTALLPSLDDVRLLAVPKKKVSPHRKGKRSATKFIRFVPVVAQCSKCERVFQPHAMPSKCAEDDCPAFNLRPRPEAGSDA